MTKKIVSKSEKNTYRYGLQETYCKLYADSKDNKVFKHLMKYIIAEDNIVLAYRNICKNKGSFTAGVDGKIITDIQKYPIEVVAQKVRNKLLQYQPKKVRRVLVLVKQNCNTSVQNFSEKLRIYSTVSLTMSL